MKEESEMDETLTAPRERSWTRRLWSFAQPYTLGVMASVALSVTLLGLALYLPQIPRRLLDDAVAHHDRALVRHLIWLWFGLLAVQGAIAGVRMVISFVTGERIARDIRNRLQKKITQLDMKFFGERSPGDVLASAVSRIYHLRWFVLDGLPNIVLSLCQLVGVGFYLFYVNPKLAALGLIPTPALIFSTYLYMRFCGAPAVRADRSWSKLYNTLSRVIYGLREVQVSAQEEREIRRYERDSQEYVRHGTEYQVNYAVYSPLFGLITQLGTLAIWALGCVALIDHQMTIGQLTAFLGYLGYFYGPVTQLSGIAGQIVSARTAAERVLEILDAEVEVAPPPEPKHLEQLQGRIEFREVVFTYNGRENALDGVTLTIEPGEKIGLVGPSGSGKTTLANLVGYFYKPTKGEVCIDGVSLRDLDPTELRRQVAMVLQDPVIFPGTIAENIAYGRPEAPLEEIIDVAKKANAHEFIHKLPDGYDTQVGDRGLGLSGGQRQRISIARALLQDPRILVLDEPTSALDAESEALIQQALEGLMEGRTTIIIAHRLPTLKFTDRIVVMDKGRIVEAGSYEELMAQDGLFHKLWSLQMREGTVNGRFNSPAAQQAHVFDVEVLTVEAQLQAGDSSLELVQAGENVPVEVVCAQPVREREGNVILQRPDGKLYFLPHPDQLRDAASRDLLRQHLRTRYEWRYVTDVQHVRYKRNGRITFCVNLTDGDRDIFDVAGMAHLHRINGSLLATSTRGVRYYMELKTCSREVRQKIEGLTI